MLIESLGSEVDEGKCDLLESPGNRRLFYFLACGCIANDRQASLCQPIVDLSSNYFSSIGTRDVVILMCFLPALLS